MVNCLKQFPFSCRYYLLHPWEFAAQCRRNLKAARQRITRGWADRDTWNLDDYLLDILPEMVDYLREHTHGYPNEFGEPEKWNAFLKLEIVDRLKNAREDQTVLKNEYEEAFNAIPLKMEGNRIVYTDEEKETLKKWAMRRQEIFEWREEELKKGLAAMGDAFFDLWD